MVDLEIETVDAEMVDADVDPVAVVDAGVTDMAEMVDADADPVAVVDTGVTDMDVDSPADADGYGLGIEDYGRLISSFPSEALVSNFCSSRHMAPSGNQLDVDSCLAFTLCAALSFLVGLTCGDGQNTLEFSAQEMVDCIPIGVGGTKYALGYDYVQRKGLHLITDYPYTATYGTPCRCPELKGRLKYYFEGYVSIPPDLAPEALMYRPLTAGIPLYKSFEKFRTPHVSVEALMGIYSPLEGEEPRRGESKIAKGAMGVKCREARRAKVSKVPKVAKGKIAKGAKGAKVAKGVVLYHALLVIGRGTQNSQPFSIIKNWWGPTWGVNGYARVASHLLVEYAYPTGFRQNLIPPGED